MDAKHQPCYIAKGKKGKQERVQMKVKVETAGGEQMWGILMKCTSLAV